jgi:hypothetical protein
MRSEVDVVCLLSAHVGVAIVPSGTDLPGKLAPAVREDADLACAPSTSQARS